MTELGHSAKRNGRTLLALAVGAIFVSGSSCAATDKVAIESGGHYVWRSVPWSILELSMPIPSRESVMSVQAKLDSTGRLIFLKLIVPGVVDIKIPEAVTKRLAYPLLHTMRVFYPEPMPATGAFPVQLMVDLWRIEDRAPSMCSGDRDAAGRPVAEMFLDTKGNEIVTLIRDECDDVKEEFTTPIATK